MAKPASDRLKCSTSDLTDALSSVSSGATIYLAPGCTYWLTSGLSDTKANLTIVGYDSTLERAPYASSFTILTVACMKTLTIDDVNFINGGDSPDDNGGAIYNDGGHLTVDAGTFSDNHSAEYGGAIYSNRSDATLTVSHAYFTGNSAEDGGAVEIGDNTTATISSSTFSRNSTPNYYGGAIENDGTANITFSLFLGNSGKWGGAIYNHYELSTADNTVAGNRAYEGGGIFEQRAALDDDGSLIIGNAATHLGGGIYNGSCVDMTLTGTTIFGNVVDNVYNHGDC
jgi:predicted outer membrane repeat protein